MSLSNLPPGCSDSDIPGNRPEDVAEEEFWNTLFEEAESSYLPEEWWEDEGICKIVTLARDLGYTRGYNDGRMEAEIEICYREEQAEIDAERRIA